MGNSTKKAESATEIFDSWIDIDMDAFVLLLF